MFNRRAHFKNQYSHKVELNRTRLTRRLSVIGNRRKKNKSWKINRRLKNKLKLRLGSNNANMNRSKSKVTAMINGWYKSKISIISFSKRKRDLKKKTSYKKKELSLKSKTKIIMHIKIG